VTAAGHRGPEAVPAPPPAAVDSIRNGTQITWAMTRSQPLAEALRRDLSTLLEPYRCNKEDQ
jgi:hypothetical protein